MSVEGGYYASCDQIISVELEGHDMHVKQRCSCNRGVCKNDVCQAASLFCCTLSAVGGGGGGGSPRDQINSANGNTISANVQP